MKNFKTLAIALLVTFSALNASAQAKKIDAAKSKINWLAKKVTGQHEGTVNFKSGSLAFKGDKVIGGEFTVDMTSLTSTDLTGEYLAKLNGHLKSDDFFSTAKFPEATLKFTKVTPKAKGSYTVEANLTIKGISKPVTFDLNADAKSATTTFKVDRTKYDIKYGSGSFFDNLGDKAIDNEFELKVNLQF